MGKANKQTPFNKEAAKSLRWKLEAFIKNKSSEEGDSSEEEAGAAH